MYSDFEHFIYLSSYKSVSQICCIILALLIFLSITQQNTAVLVAYGGP